MQLKLKFSKVRQKAREPFFEIRAAAECLFRAWRGVRRAHSANGKSAAIRDELRFKAVRKHAPRILGLCAAVQHFEIRRFRLLHGAFPNIKEL